MPRLITPPADEVARAIDLDALVDWCESPAFDPSCEDGLAAAAPMLRALARNRHFLADAAVAELKTRCADQRRFNPYSAQVMLLRPPGGKYVLRAAFWPAVTDHVVRASGTAPFLYHVPHDHGFDHWMATQNNAAPSHKNPTNFVRNGEPVGPLQGYSSHLVVEEAIRWLRQRDPQRPFLLNVWTHEPHLPIESDPQYMALYDTPDVGLRQHHGNVTQLDAAFGKLMAALDELQLADSTLVLFTADNGPEGSGLPDLKNPGSQRDRTRGSTGGLRGRKRDDFEGGIRVPGLARWPKQIPAGSESHVPVIGTDIFVTLCELARVAVPQDRVIDGGSMVPAFTGKPVTRARPLYWRTHISSPASRVALRDGDWKIVANKQLDQFLLFNLADDPQEKRDLAQDEPTRLARLKEALLALNAEVLAEGPDWVEEDR